MTGNAVRGHQRRRYVSRDGGVSFTPWSDGLEPKATVAVAVSPAYAEDRLVYGLGLGGAPLPQPLPCARSEGDSLSKEISVGLDLSPA